MSRILLIEDSRTQAFATTRLLEKNGHEVIVATCGGDGIHFAREQSPDLIITDILLPDTNGFQVTREITRHDRTRHIPVVVLSSKDQTADKIWGLRQGAMSYLTKPVQEQELIDTVDHLLGRAAA